MKMATVFALVLVFLCASLWSATFTFWTAPNPNQEAFWKRVIEDWKAERPDVVINWRTIPAAASSEEAILNAIATGRGPDLCTNIFSGFAAQLIEAQQLVELSKLDGFHDLIATRKMEEAILGWQFQEKSYVFPIYSNPMLFWWRSDILQDLGYDQPPRTYSEVYDLAERFAVPREKFAIEFLKGRNWWDRWFDFVTFFYAATGGQPYIDINRNRALFGDDRGKEILTFGLTLFQKGWTSMDMMDNPLYTGHLLGQLQGPWEMPRAEQIFPKVFPGNIWMSMPPVPDDYPEDQPVYTFADTKGLVIFKNSRNIDLVWDFVKWVFSNEEYDRLWMEMTNMPPVRSDIAINPLFQDILEKNPGLKAYAEAIPYAIPPALTPRTIEVQDAMTVYMTEPLSLQRGTVDDILRRVVREINAILF